MDSGHGYHQIEHLADVEIVAELTGCLGGSEQGFGRSTDHGAVIREKGGLNATKLDDQLGSDGVAREREIEEPAKPDGHGSARSLPNDRGSGGTHLANFVNEQRLKQLPFTREIPIERGHANVSSPRYFRHRHLGDPGAIEGGPGCHENLLAVSGGIGAALTNHL